MHKLYRGFRVLSKSIRSKRYTALRYVTTVITVLRCLAVEEVIDYLDTSVADMAEVVVWP